MHNWHMQSRLRTLRCDVASKVSMTVETCSNLLCVFKGFVWGRESHFGFDLGLLMVWPHELGLNDSHRNTGGWFQ